MKNKFKRNELVIVNGLGKIFGRVKNKLGFIEDKDEYYKDYYVGLISDNKDWFEEHEIKSVWEKEGKNDCR